MAFASYIYEADGGASSYLIRLDTDQGTLAGGVVGTPTAPFHVLVHGSNRSLGLRPRFVSLRRAEGANGEGRVHSTRLAICTERAFAALNKNDAVSVNGVVWAVSSKTSEKMN
jgi:hypothetical protein